MVLLEYIAVGDAAVVRVIVAFGARWDVRELLLCEYELARSLGPACLARVGCPLRGHA